MFETEPGWHAYAPADGPKTPMGSPMQYWFPLNTPMKPELEAKGWRFERVEPKP